MGLWSQLRLGILFQIYVVVGRFHFLAAVELMVTCFFKVRKGISRFYLKSLILSQIVFPLTENQQVEKLNYVCKIRSPWPANVTSLWLRTATTPALSQVWPAFKRKGSYRLCIRRGILLGHQKSATNFPHCLLNTQSLAPG
jgi:hypothetical protein